jgi:hypothetical protein
MCVHLYVLQSRGCTKRNFWWWVKMLRELYRLCLSVLGDWNNVNFWQLDIQRGLCNMCVFKKIQTGVERNRIVIYYIFIWYWRRRCEAKWRPIVVCFCAKNHFIKHSAVNVFTRDKQTLNKNYNRIVFC